jgi:hypothetical protein
MRNLREAFADAIDIPGRPDDTLAILGTGI